MTHNFRPGTTESILYSEVKSLEKHIEQLYKSLISTNEALNHVQQQLLALTKASYDRSTD